MRILSIKQPWASLIAHGIKDIENRTWKTHFRGRIYIHASGKCITFLELLKHSDMVELYRVSPSLRDNHDEYLSYTRSAIIGEVDIIDCVINHPSIWAEKTFMYEANEETGEKPIGKPIYNWVLANPVLYEKPILNIKGKLSFWEFEKEAITENLEVPEWWNQYKKANPNNKKEYNKNKHCCSRFWKDFCNCVR